MPQVLDLVYIMSASYTGSTLLTFLLGGHPAVGTIGELKGTSMGDIDAYQCSCGQKIRDCSFWTGLQAELARRGEAFDLADFGTHFRGSTPWSDRLLRSSVRGSIMEAARSAGLLLHGDARDDYKRILRRNGAMMDAISSLQGRSVFLDGSKDPVRLRHLLASGLWNVKVIYLVRDGRGVTNSYMRHYGVGMDIAAEEWRRTHRECRRLLQRLGEGSWRRVRYEDLCTDTEITVRELLEFLGLAPEQWKAHDPASLHVVGNQMRLGNSTSIQLDEKWRTALSPQDIGTFERMAGTINRELGYA